MKNQGMRCFFKIDGKMIDLWMTPELVGKMATLMEENPEKYQGGQGFIRAYLDAKNV